MTRELSEQTADAAKRVPPWWRRTRDAEVYHEAKRRLEAAMLILAIAFTIALRIGCGELAGAARLGVAAVDILIWLLFIAEYLWLLRLAPDRRKHVRTHVLDLVIIVLPVLRPLRALRVFVPCASYPSSPPYAAGSRSSG